MRWIWIGWLVLMSSSASWSQRADVLQIGDPIATTVQLPTFGVSFDAEGVLQLRTVTDPTGRLAAERVAFARATQRGNLARPVHARKVSLTRLHASMLQRQQDGDPPSEVMQKLAGLTRIESVFCYPDSGDVILCGPAEPWVTDLSGRVIGLETGRPTLLLADLAAAIRAYAPQTQHRGFVGCTINPRAEGLAKLVEFQRTIPRSIPQRQRGPVTQRVAQGVRDSLGMAEVKVFGVSPRTHFAHVMIEADYRMKRIAVGVEPPPVRMTTFASALTTASAGSLERWWFTPAYDGLRTSPDRLAMRITGQGVELQAENKEILADGTIVPVRHQTRSAGRGNKATRVFATSFTRRYGDIAAASPVFAQLRQMTDFLIVAAFMRRHDWYRQSRFEPTLFLQEDSYPIDTLPRPHSAAVVVNAFWKQNRLFTPAGGGVSIEAEKAIEEMVDDESLDARRKEILPAEQATTWWWD